jgi:hypothetical protein
VPAPAAATARSQQPPPSTSRGSGKRPKAQYLDTLATFDVLWKFLSKEKKWTHRQGKGLVSFYYVLPGRQKLGGKRGTDYFASPEGVCVGGWRAHGR